jgi:hypothetical protein
MYSLTQEEYDADVTWGDSPPNMVFGEPLESDESSRDNPYISEPIANGPLKRCFPKNR